MGDKELVDKQTKWIVNRLCDEIRQHSEEYSKGQRKGSFAKSLFEKQRLHRTSQSFDSDADQPVFELGELSFESGASASSLEYIEADEGPDLSLEDSLNDSYSDDRDEAIEAIIAAINHMAVKFDKNAKVANALDKTYTHNKGSFTNYNTLIQKILDEISPGVAPDSWGNAIFLILIALNLVDLKSYPSEFFKRYVYAKIVPWVTMQPGGWLSAKDDEKVGKVVRKYNEENNKVSFPIPRERSDSTSSSDYASSPSSFLNWFTFPKRSSSFHSDI